MLDREGDVWASLKLRGGAAVEVRYSGSTDSTDWQLTLPAYKESLWATLCAVSKAPQ